MSLLNNKILTSWINFHKIKDLSQSTMIPIGILIKIYDQYSGHVIDFSNTLEKQVSQIIGSRMLKLYMEDRKITQLSPYTMFPFALIMGDDVFVQEVRATSST